MAVEQGRVSPVAQQQGAHLHSVFRCRLVKWGELPQIHGVHTRPMLGKKEERKGGGGGFINVRKKSSVFIVE